MAAAMEKSSDHLHAVSDSDDDRPFQEPELVIHIVDDHRLPSRPPPPPPPRQLQQRPHAFQPQPQALFVAARDDKRHLGKKCSACFVVRIVHCLLVMALAAVTVVLAARVPKEFSAGSPYMVMCPVFICILAFTWIFFADYGDVDDDD